jgi:hypothetical protein
LTTRSIAHSVKDSIDIQEFYRTPQRLLIFEKIAECFTERLEETRSWVKLEKLSDTFPSDLITIVQWVHTIGEATG